MAERFKAAVLKTAFPPGNGGSNPSPSAMNQARFKAKPRIRRVYGLAGITFGSWKSRERTMVHDHPDPISFRAPLKAVCVNRISKCPLLSGEMTEKA
jgi:hypothetical protein